MDKFFISIALISFFVSSCQGATLNFANKNNSSSNLIIKQKLNDIKEYGIISHYFDIDDDGKKEILGLVKSQQFYTSSGYKLIVLKNTNGNWENIQTDVYFDPTQEFSINNKKITYHKSFLYNNKKCKAKYKNNEVKTSKSIFNFFKNQKAKNIEQITAFHKSTLKNNFELTNFNAHPQRSININYTNLNEKTKHYLEMK